MDKLRYWSALLHESNFFTDILHWIGWALVKGLQTVTDLVENLVDTMYGLLDFTSYASIDKFFNHNALKILLTVLLIFAILVLAWNFLFNNKENKPKIIQQLCTIVIVVCAMPLIFSFLNTITIQARNYISGGATTNISNQIIAEGIVDLKYIDSQGFDNYNVNGNAVIGKKEQQKNGFLGGKESNVAYVDPSEKITKDTKVNTPDILLKRIGTTDNGTLIVEEIKTEKFLGIDMTNWYYRYYVDYLSIYLCLLATIIAYFFTAWKVGKIIFELAFHQLLAVFMAASDLTTGQRIKTVFKSLGSIYVVLMLLPILLKLFVLGQAYVGSHVTNGFVKGFILVALAFAVIDGPNIIERVLGVDAGIRSGFQTLATAFMLTRGAASAAKGVGKTIGAVGGAAAGAAVGGIKDGIDSFKNERNSASEINTSNGGIQDELNSQQTNNSLDNSNEHVDNNGIGVDGEQGKVIGAETGSNNDLTTAAVESGIVAQIGADNAASPEKEENGINKSLDNSSSVSAQQGQGISSQVKKSLDEKGIKSPSRGMGIRPNPQSIAGTAAQSYQNGRMVGGAVGGKIGQVAGKITNKVSPPKPPMGKEDK